MSLGQPTQNTMTDEQALQELKFDIAYASQDEWLKGQFNSRVPYPSRVNEIHEGKNGHPFLFSSKGLDALVSILTDNHSEGFESDLYIFKLLLSNTFHQPIEYFDYLNSVPSEEFYNWIRDILQKLYENNSNWNAYVEGILRFNKIDFSDLFEGKLSDESLDKLIKIRGTLFSIQNAKNYAQLTKSLLDAGAIGILPQMISAHEQWRNTYHKITVTSISNDSPIRLMSMNTDLSSRIDMLFTEIISLDEITFQKIFDKIIEFRKEIESDPEIPAVQSFYVLWLITLKSSQLSVNANLDADTKLAFQQSFEKMMAIIKCDANPAPIEMVVNLYQAAKVKRAQEEALMEV